MSRHITERSVVGVLADGHTAVYHRRYLHGAAWNVNPRILAECLKEISALGKDERSRTVAFEFRTPLGKPTATKRQSEDIIRWFRRPGYGNKLFPFVMNNKPSQTSTITIELWRCKQSGRHILLHAYLGWPQEAHKMEKKRWSEVYAFTNEEPRLGKIRHATKRDKYRERR